MLTGLYLCFSAAVVIAMLGTARYAPPPVTCRDFALRMARYGITVAAGFSCAHVLQEGYAPPGEQVLLMAAVATVYTLQWLDARERRPA